MARKTPAEAAKTRQKIISAGISAFASDGIATVTLEQIARQAGVTRGAVYWHFRNKEDLLSKILEEQNHPLEHMIPASLPFAESWLRLRQALIETIKSKEAREFSELMLHKSELHDAAGPVSLRLQRLRGCLTWELQELLRRAVARHELTASLDIPAFCELFRCCIAGVLFECLKEDDCEQTLTLAMDTLLHLLQCPPSHLCQMTQRLKDSASILSPATPTLLSEQKS